jgi:hypothetical protein
MRDYVFEIYDCDCGGKYIIDDDIWPVRKHCDKCHDYIDLSQTDYLGKISEFIDVI